MMVAVAFYNEIKLVDSSSIMLIASDDLDLNNTSFPLGRRS